jgi:hypothetical protein
MEEWNEIWDTILHTQIDNSVDKYSDSLYFLDFYSRCIKILQQPKHVKNRDKRDHKNMRQFMFLVFTRVSTKYVFVPSVA